MDPKSLQAISSLIGAGADAEEHGTGQRATRKNKPTDDDGSDNATPTKTPKAMPFVPTATLDPSSFAHEFWSHVIQGAEAYEDDFRESALPLARIKRVMKTDSDVKRQMISSEVPVLFSKACEIFISELTGRAFLVATGANRRTLHRADVAAAVGKSDVFDFLLDVISPNQLRPPADEDDGLAE